MSGSPPTGAHESVAALVRGSVRAVGVGELLVVRAGPTSAMPVHEPAHGLDAAGDEHVALAGA